MRNLLNNHTMHLTDEHLVHEDAANNPIMEAEVCTALKSMKNDHAAGYCSIVAEQLKYRGEKIIEWLTMIMNQAWTVLEIPDDWHRGTIIQVWKGKANTWIVATTEVFPS